MQLNQINVPPYRRTSEQHCFARLRFGRVVETMPHFETKTAALEEGCTKAQMRSALICLGSGLQGIQEAFKRALPGHGQSSRFNRNMRRHFRKMTLLQPLKEVHLDSHHTVLIDQPFDLLSLSNWVYVMTLDWWLSCDIIYIDLSVHKPRL